MRFRSPADWLIRPELWAAAAGLLANDRILKKHMPGLVTGKLSDVFGMFVVPFVWMAMVVLAASLLRVRLSQGAAWRWWCALVIAAGACLAWVKSSALGADLYGQLIGYVRMVLLAPVDLLMAGHVRTPTPIQVVVDPSDIVAVLALVPASWVARRVIWGAEPDSRDKTSRDLGHCAHERRR